MDSIDIATSHTPVQPNVFADKVWHYHFRELPFTFEEKRLKKMSGKYQENIFKTIQHWNKETNSEWVCRFFASVRLILSATSHINTANAVEDKNLMITSPYLRYYALLSLFRTVCYTLPEIKWDHGKMIRISHDNATKLTLSYLEKLDKHVAKAVKDLFKQVKNKRELTAYNAYLKETDATEIEYFLSICRLLVEIAQFNSELFESTLLEHDKFEQDTFPLLDDYLDKIAFFQVESYLSEDNNHQICNIAKKYPQPRNLMALMSNGYIDAHLHWWVGQDDFNAHSAEHFFGNRRIIFDVP